MRILGIDPGIEKTGFAIIELSPRGAVRLLDCGCIYTMRGEAIPARLHQLNVDLKSIISEWRPEEASIEQVFFSKNVKTAMSVSQARGVILAALEKEGIAIFEFNPLQIKKTVTGDARADKKQMQKMIQYQLGIELKNDDTIDAIACGICLVANRKILQT